MSIQLGISGAFATEVVRTAFPGLEWDTDRGTPGLAPRRGCKLVELHYTGH